MTKIAYCIRPDYLECKGGDSVQLLKTKFFVEEQDSSISIDILTVAENITEEYSLVHIFNYANSIITQSFFERALSLNIKIVSSPIYWDYAFAYRPFLLRMGYIPSFLSKKIVLFSSLIYKLIAKIFNYPFLLSNKFSERTRFFINSSDRILPNSNEEAELLLKFANLELDNYKNKIDIVYNGVDIEETVPISSSLFFEKYNIPPNFVVQIGRIQYIKNQLNLLSALMDEPEIPLVFIGKIIEADYYKKLLKLAEQRGNVFFIEEIPHEDVYSFLFYAKVHVLLSFRESPGLVSLEALSQMCNIVIPDSRFLPVKTYFEQNYYIVDLFDKKSILEGVRTALETPAEFVSLRQFSWRNVGIQTYESYKKIL